MASGERGDSPRSFTRRRTAPSEVFRRMCVSAPSPRRIIPSPEACVSSASTETRKPIDVAMLPVNKRTSSVRELVMAGLRKVQSVPGTGGGNPVVGTPVSPVLTARVALFNAPASNNDGGGDDVVSKWSALAMSMAPVSTPTVGVNNENSESGGGVFSRLGFLSVKCEGTRSDGSTGAPQAATPQGSAPLWLALENMAARKLRFETQADGAAAGHPHAVREAVAKKLISNHAAVLYDVCNPSPVSQHMLPRLSDADKPFADQVLREVARRLLGCRPGSQELEVQLDPKNCTQATVWMNTVQFVMVRIQSSPEEKPGRSPDMSPEHAAAMRDVLNEVGNTVVTATLAAATPQWAMLHTLLESSGTFNSTQADGVAAAHEHAAREEAARRLIANHENVLKDVTNPSPTLNIIGVPLTQLELQRVDIGLAMYADQALREVARRLLGRRPGSHQLEERLDPSNQAQAATWWRTADYLTKRIQSNPDEKPGRSPDMSSDQAAMMRDVLKQVLEMAQGGYSQAMGAA